MTADLAYPHFRLLQDCDIQRLVPTDSTKTKKNCVGSSWPALIPKVYDCDSQETDHQTVRSSRSEFGSFGLPSPRKGFEDDDSYSRRVSGLLDNPPPTHTHTPRTHTPHTHTHTTHTHTQKGTLADLGLSSTLDPQIWATLWILPSKTISLSRPIRGNKKKKRGKVGIPLHILIPMISKIVILKKTDNHCWICS